MPCLVDKCSVSAHAYYLCIQFPELIIMQCSILKLCRADKCKVRGIKQKNYPLSRVTIKINFFHLIIMVNLKLKIRDFLIYYHIIYCMLLSYMLYHTSSHRYVYIFGK